MKKMISHLAVLAGLAAMAAASPVLAKPLDLSKGADALTAMRKVQCSTKDSKPVVYHWSGRAYSRVPGEPDKHLFNVEGMNVRQCVTINDPVKGPGFRMVSRELMFYLDPKTGEALTTWKNPWSGKTVDVIHVANDPVNMPPMFATDAAGKPFSLNARVQNGRVFMASEIPLFYRNPLAGDYQTYVGNHYHAMEIFDFAADEADLLDPKKSEASPIVAWVRIAEWLPWMEMSGRSGLMVVNATGQTVAGIDALPPVIREQIKANYPEYADPPPVDDKRPNETSWTYFKKVLDRKATAAK